MSALRYRLLDAALAYGVIPDAALRSGSRLGAGWRERRELRGGIERQEHRLRVLVDRMTTGSIAELPEKANEQHYELPAEFLGIVLGPRRKYSGCLWEAGTTTLAQAEEAMLEVTCRRAQVRDGMRILDLGCGWGSLSLWLAEHYPNAQIVGVSNSHGQREWIEAQACKRGLDNVRVITADVNDFTPEGHFDRVVSIEMFEHLRNWQELLRRISTWLAEDGKLFVHVFTHRSLPYLFESTWAAERFFSAGVMPSHDLLLRFQRDLELEDRWAVNGTHYQRTLTAWLRQLDRRAEEALTLLQSSGRTPAEARVLLGGWRLFLISAAQMWGYKDGDAWIVSHYLLRHRTRGSVT